MHTSPSQVEVYTNTTDLWSKRQALLIEMYASLSTIDMDNFAHTNQWAEEEREEEQGDDRGWLHWILPGEKEKDGMENNSLQSDVQHTASSYVEQHTLYELFDVYSKFSETLTCILSPNCVVMYTCPYMYLFMYMVCWEIDSTGIFDTKNLQRDTVCCSM